MEIITEPKGAEVDEIAERVFLKAIEIVGGLKKLVEFRNLTWLPSLAKASYAVVYREEAAMSADEIAERLGMTKQSVRNMLSADPEEIKRFIEGEEEEISEHKAGGLAKLAYMKLKERGELERTFMMTEKMLDELGVLWAGLVLHRIRGLDFPVKRDELRDRLKGIVVKDKKIEELIEKLPEEIKTPAELLHLLKEASESS
ncbi:MAG: KaiC associated regulatory domain-containing protein [Archaeoglobi archaeon]|nr:KaiC associated regulatory domain-containing protein [Candidatus Mnemosynella bozhongmuii]